MATFLMSYQQKKRKHIILLNAISRCLYIIQYIMLGAFEGAVLDVLGAVSSVAAQNKERKVIKSYYKAVVVGIDLIIFAAGAFMYKNVFSLFPVLGVILHTSAFWINKESVIRKVSLIGSPFWLVYNIVSGAYGSAIGDVLTMVSIGIALVRYDIMKRTEYSE